MVFGFFCFYLYLFNVPNSIHFDYLATLWMVLNWYPGVVKSLRLRKIIMHSGINQRNFEKEILNLNCDKWTNVGESMWKGSRRLKWRLPLSAFHKAWLLTILSANLILFNLFVSLQPFTRPFLMEHQNEDFFFSVCLSSTYLSICRLISLLSLFFFSLLLFLFVIIRYWCRCKSYQCFTW